MHAAACKRCAIELNRRHPSGNPLWVLDVDFVARRVIAEYDVKAPPCTWDTRVEIKPRAAQTEAENPLDAGPIHPTRGSGVPGPAAAADMRRFGINIGGDDIGLDLIAVNAGAAVGMIDRVQEREKFAGLIAVTECGESQDAPDRRMGILAAIFANAGQVPFDVAWVRACAVKWRGEKQDQLVLAIALGSSRPPPWPVLHEPAQRHRK